MESTWAKTRTTHGHGINSQYKPEHWKEWVNGEKRNQERSSSPERSLNDDSSFHRSSLFYPIESDTPITHKHHAASKSLAELRQYQVLPPSLGHSTQFPKGPGVVTAQPLTTKHLPHMAHHHHFGWNPPTPQSRIAVFDPKHQKDNHSKWGDAQKYNDSIHSKASVMISRKA